MTDLEERLDEVIADWQRRTLASLPIEEVKQRYRQMKAEQEAAGSEPQPRSLLQKLLDY